MTELIDLNLTSEQLDQIFNKGSAVVLIHGRLIKINIDDLLIREDDIIKLKNEISKH